MPNYKEFYEARWFTGADDNHRGVIDINEDVSFGNNLLFQSGDLVVGCEICEDLWTPIPPSSVLALQGANLIVNLSASNDMVGKPEYRRNLVIGQSARCISGYAP